MRRPGFTLLELLFVVVILAILASVAVPSFTHMLEKAKVQDAETSLRVIYQAQRVYRLDQVEYGSLTGSSNACPAPGTLVCSGYLPNPNPNDHWTFVVTVRTATAFTARATRRSGPFKDAYLQIDQTGKLCQCGYEKRHADFDKCPECSEFGIFPPL